MGDETSQIRLVRNSGPHAIPRGAFATRRNVAGWAALAASLVLVAALGVEYGRNVRAERTRPAPVDPGREYRTSVGQRASVTLPDGSAFELGPASRLRIPPGYGAPNRIVELEGDGYFNVVHDEQHPFAVRTARTIIRDLGTRFVVRARPAERRVEVAVADGQVAVAPASPERVSAGRDTSALTLTAGQAALVDDRGMQRLGKQAVTAQFAWTRGEFVFDHVRVPVVLNELSRWYGTRFVLADASLDTVRLTTTLRGETMLEALVVLEAALDVDARVDGDRVTLTRHSTKDR